MNAAADKVFEPFDELKLAQIVVQKLEIDVEEVTEGLKDRTSAGCQLFSQEQIRTVQNSLLMAECQQTQLQLVHHLRRLLRDLRHQTVSGMRQTTIK